MGTFNDRARAERRSLTQARLLRSIICVLGTGLLFTELFGEWVWQLQLVLGAIAGVSISILTEVLLLIWQDEHRLSSERAEHATITRTRERNRPD
jgi:hypothetical protein